MSPEPAPASLQELLAQAGPARLLAVGPAACEIARDHAERHGECGLSLRNSRDAGELLGTGETVDVALLEGGEAGPDSTIAPLLLGRLRDVLARLTLVLVPDTAPAAAPWRREDLRSLGYVRAGRYQWGEAAFDVYRFDIATYKTTPDWLNPEDWANPELWDKYRW